MKKLLVLLTMALLLLPNAFAQQSCGTVKDYDGNTYRTVQIGSQCWMAENLRTTHYSNGTSIPQGNSESETTGYWYYPDGNSGNKRTYGLLYNWPAVMHGSSSSSSNPSGVQGICPVGWHVPSDAEWTQLTSYVKGHNEYVCPGCSGTDDEWTTFCIAKALASTSGWMSDTDPCAVGNDQNSNNATGFSAVPAGRYNGSVGYFGGFAYFWSATQYYSSTAYYRPLSYRGAGVSRPNIYKNYGCSVRCVRD